MDFTRVDRGVEAHEVVENWSVELPLDGLFAMNHAAHRLPFILMSDVDSIVRKLYGVPTVFGLPGRVTYVIDRHGIVRRIFFSQFTSEKHVTEALSTLQSIREDHI